MTNMRIYQGAISAGDMIDIGHRCIAAVLCFLAIQPGKTLGFFHGQLALGIERRHLGALLANLGGELLRRLAVEISVNEPG